MVSFGVDGCKSGWFYVRHEAEHLAFGVVTNLDELITFAPDSALVLIDIPIGLRDQSPKPRGCDTAARKLLGAKRSSSVFPAPIRPALREASYAAALSKSRQLSGKGLSQQAYGIAPKIREIDDLLTTSERARSMVREAHPELCFWAFAGRPMTHRKKTSEGFRERMELLKRVLPGSEPLVVAALSQCRRKDVARDDIADALILSATATAPEASLRTVPDTPELDSMGLPMEMVYSIAMSPRVALHHREI